MATAGVPAVVAVGAGWILGTEARARTGTSALPFTYQAYDFKGNPLGQPAKGIITAARITVN
jgi:hypothetical protein